jgi:hypothetical protein
MTRNILEPLGWLVCLLNILVIGLEAYLDRIAWWNIAVVALSIPVLAGNRHRRLRRKRNSTPLLMP